MKVKITQDGKVVVSVRGKKVGTVTPQKMDAAARKAKPGARLLATGTTPVHVARIYS